MKKYLLLFSAFASISILITSCKLDPPIYPGQPGYVDYTPSKSAGNTGTVGDASLLVGKWYPRNSVSIGTFLGTPINQTETDYTTDDYFLLNSDYTAVVSQSGPPVTMEAGTYTFLNNRLTVTTPSQTENYTVTTLTSTTLVLVEVIGGLTSTITLTQ